MRQRIASWVLTAFLTIGSTGRAAAPAATQGAEPGVTALIAQLDADDWRARDAATAQLVDRGEAVRPAMVDAAEHAASLEVRRRAAGILARLRRIAAERPTTVTLHLAGVNPRAAFAALSKQAGVPIGVWPEWAWVATSTSVVRPIDVDLDAVPFWVAVDRVCTVANGHVTSGRDAINVTDGTGDGRLLGGPVCDAGRVLVVGRTFERNREVDLADGRQTARDALKLVVLLDPKVTLDDDRSPSVSIDRMVDDAGGELVPSTHKATGGYYGESGNLLFNIEVDVGAPAPGATRVGQASGVVSGIRPALPEPLVIDDLAHAGSEVRTAGSFAVRLNRATVTGKSVAYHMSVRSFAGLTVPTTGLRLEDASGTPIVGQADVDQSRPADGDGQIRVDGKVDVEGAIRGPVRLVWRLPAVGPPLVVPFELHDLRLPTP